MEKNCVGPIFSFLFPFDNITEKFHVRERTAGMLVVSGSFEGGEFRSLFLGRPF